MLLHEIIVCGIKHMNHRHHIAGDVSRQIRHVNEINLKMLYLLRSIFFGASSGSSSGKKLK